MNWQVLSEGKKISQHIRRAQLNSWLYQHSSEPHARCAANSWHYQNVLFFAPTCVPFSNKIRLCMKYIMSSQKTVKEYFYTLCFTYLRSPRSFRPKWTFQSLHTKKGKRKRKWFYLLTFLNNY